jgi:hypothetical protein
VPGSGTLGVRPGLRAPRRLYQSGRTERRGFPRPDLMINGFLAEVKRDAKRGPAPAPQLNPG